MAVFLPQLPMCWDYYTPTHTWFLPVVRLLEADVRAMETARPWLWQWRPYLGVHLLALDLGQGHA